MEISDKIPEELQNGIILYALSENLNQLSILKCINGWSEDNQSTIEYKTIQERFGEETGPELEHLSSEINLEDFRKDCAFVESIITQTFNEIASSGTYNELVKLIKIFKDTNRDEDELVLDTKNKQKEVQKLQKNIFNEEQHFCNYINECTAEIGRLKDDIEYLMLESEKKLNYVDNWQSSKQEMNTLKLNTRENANINLIRKKQHQCITETRVHEEMENIFDEIQMEYGSDITFWKNKYETDLNAINSKIDAISEKRGQQMEATAKLRELYLNRQQEIDQFTEYKIKQQEQRREHKRREVAATLLEAWWRGVMVRKGFGKFRKKKDKKGKKKGSTEKKPK